MDSRQQFLVALVFGVLVTGYGLYMGYGTLSQQSSADTEVDATVLESSVVTESDSRTGDDFHVHIEYAYTYDGRNYTSTNVYPGPTHREFDDRGPAAETVREYPEGSTVTAYVDSEAPGESYLIAADTDRTLLGAGIVVGIGLVGLLAALLIGADVLYDSVQPGPGEVSPDRRELREQFLRAFSEIDDYPVESLRDVRLSSLDLTREFQSNDFEMTVASLDTVVESPPESPCEDAEELTEYLMDEMERQGYFL